MTKFNSEEEFLKSYDDSIFEKPSITTDIAVFSVSSGEKENWRRLSNKKLSVLLVKRNNYPFKDMWCLPGSFINMSETTNEAANRILELETGMRDVYLEQLYTFSDIDRDPRTRVISVSYVALIDKSNYEEVLENARWFDLEVSIENDVYNFELTCENEVLSFSVLKDGDNFKKINTCLAFDHDLVIAMGLLRIKNKVEYTDIAFNLMPELFTLGELQQVYETILGKKLLDPAFRRIIADKVEKTSQIKTGGGHRPSVLYKFKSN